ncbi:MAG: hypothetical protein KF767_08960 [Bdellovibrionaceae bacterium]|nr:hypothetical protein [Pseudobdellovibrionaceae bacterium]
MTRYTLLLGLSASLILTACVPDGGSGGAPAARVVDEAPNLEPEAPEPLPEEPTLAELTSGDIQSLTLTRGSESLTFTSSEIQDTRCYGGRIEIKSVTEADGIVTVSAERDGDVPLDTPTHQDCMLEVGQSHLAFYYGGSCVYAAVDPYFHARNITYQLSRTADGEITVARSLETMPFQRSCTNPIGYGPFTGSIAGEVYHE